MEELISDSVELKTHCRDIWQTHPETRLEKWHEFRTHHQAHGLTHYLEVMQQFWNFAPEKSLSIDPHDPNSWLTLWEMLMNSEVCKYSKGIALCLSVYYVFPDLDNKIVRVNDRNIGDTYIAVIISNQLLLNHENFQISTYPGELPGIEIEQTFAAAEVDRLIQTRT